MSSVPRKAVGSTTVPPLRLVREEDDVKSSRTEREPLTALKVLGEPGNQTLISEASTSLHSIQPPVTPSEDSPQPAQEKSEPVYHGLEPNDELLAELSQVSDELESAHPSQILRWAIERFRDRFTMATAFGPEGMCLLHWIAEIDRHTSVFNLETGYQFAETLELRERVTRRYGLEVELKRPQLSVAEYEQINGGPVYKTDPNRCCLERKISLIRSAVEGKHCWASAIRRDQTQDRSRVPIVGWDKKFGLIKVSPLANWTKAQVWQTIMDHDIPYNPLHDQGYASIGCWPCTRAIVLGEDERAGRWSGSQKTECGLHSSD